MLVEGDLKIAEKLNNPLTADLIDRNVVIKQILPEKYKMTNDIVLKQYVPVRGDSDEEDLEVQKANQKKQVQFQQGSPKPSHENSSSPKQIQSPHQDKNNEAQPALAGLEHVDLRNLTEIELAMKMNDQGHIADKPIVIAVEDELYEIEQLVRHDDEES
jgi:hypothetical protein